ncbi:hypothetical protein ABBQ32_012429 [Trebouxia sp. C0010 RCD-2024]
MPWGPWPAADVCKACDFVLLPAVLCFAMPPDCPYKTCPGRLRLAPCWFSCWLLFCRTNKHIGLDSGLWQIALSISTIPSPALCFVLELVAGSDQYSDAYVGQYHKHSVSQQLQASAGSKIL